MQPKKCSPRISHREGRHTHQTPQPRDRMSGIKSISPTTTTTTAQRPGLFEAATLLIPVSIEKATCLPTPPQIDLQLFSMPNLASPPPEGLLQRAEQEASLDFIDNMISSAKFLPKEIHQHFYERFLLSFCSIVPIFNVPALKTQYSNSWTNSASYKSSIFHVQPWPSFLKHVECSNLPTPYINSQLAS